MNTNDHQKKKETFVILLMNKSVRLASILINDNTKSNMTLLLMNKIILLNIYAVFCDLQMKNSNKLPII